MTASMTIFLFSIFSFTYSIGQDTTLYRFRIEDKPSGDTNIYYGQSQEFITARVSSTKNFFIEYNLFSGQAADWRKGSIDTFKIKNNTWYIKRDGKWTYFFSQEGFKAQKNAIVRIAKIDYFFVPQKIITDKENILYQFSARPTKESIFVSDIPKYIFDPLVGIVRIFASDVILVREKISSFPAGRPDATVFSVQLCF